MSRKPKLPQKPAQTQERGHEPGLPAQTGAPSIFHKLSLNDLLQLLGVLLTVAAISVSATVSVMKLLAERDDPTKGNKSIQGILSAKLGAQKGDIVYKSLIKPLESGSAKFAYKTRMSYDIGLYDSAPPNWSPGSRLANGQYYYFKSTLDYEKAFDSKPSELIVAAVLQPSALPDWTQRPEVVYREVIGINSVDKAWVDSLVDRIESKAGIDEKLAILDSLFIVRFTMSKLPVRLRDIRREPNGYALVYEVPSFSKWSEPISCAYEYFGAWPKGECSFPIVISDPTQSLRVKLDYKHAASIDNNNLQFFQAFLAQSSAGGPKVLLDRDNRVLTIESVDDQWIFPGGGLLLWWNPK